MHLPIDEVKREIFNVYSDIQISLTTIDYVVIYIQKHPNLIMPDVKRTTRLYGVYRSSAKYIFIGCGTTQEDALRSAYLTIQKEVLTSLCS